MPETEQLNPDAPQASPMSVPSPKDGLIAEAKMRVQAAIKALERTLEAFGVNSREGKDILSVIKRLGAIAGDVQSGDLMKPEIDLLTSKVSPEVAPGGPAPTPTPPPPKKPGLNLPFSLPMSGMGGM